MYNILIDENNDITTVAVIQDYELVEVYEERNQEQRLEGNIYIGKVKNIIPGMQSAFIDIGENKNSLIHIKDILPKASNITGNAFEDTSKMDISKLIKSGDEILVQVKRDCNDKKGPRVTKEIKINGNFIIFMPYANFITVSQKIVDEAEIDRLKNIVKEILPSEYGAIIRTAANGRSKEEIRKDVEELIALWQSILEKSKIKKSEGKIPAKIYSSEGIVGKIITDLSQNNLEKIYTNRREFLDKYKAIQNKIEIVERPLEKYDTDKKIKSISRKVWLNCGGFITIDHTEALTAIDVNSGKFTGKKELEKTVLKVNLEASKEIAKQIRLRDIGGIIIIDYIDMEDEKDREQVKNYMIECLKNDRSKVQVMEFTKLRIIRDN